MLRAGGERLLAGRLVPYNGYAAALPKLITPSSSFGGLGGYCFSSALHNWPLAVASVPYIFCKICRCCLLCTWSWDLC